jgi:aryl-alcohol dehydrogenase-like predicted oxidoreductase
MLKVALGTVQFGLDYGISGSKKKTSKNEVEKILKFAANHGICTLDTAPSYGDAEEVVGDFFGNYCDTESWKIITKTPHFKSNIIGDRQVYELFDSFKVSRKKIGQNRIYGLLIHDFNDLLLPGGEKLLWAMSQLKKEGIVEKIGVSLYNSKQIDYLLDNFSIDLVQLPINIIDQRLIKGGYLKKLKKQGIEIHARSVFLQGLLLMPLNAIPAWFSPIINILGEFHKKARQRNISSLQLALGFVQSIKEVDNIVIGVNKLDQLHDIIDTNSIHVNIKKFCDLSVSNDNFLNPSKWK